AVDERHVAVGVRDADARDRLRREDLHAEAPCLRHRAPRQVAAGEPGREAEVVLDARAGPRLPAGRFTLDEHGVESFGGAVDRGGEPSRPATDDDEVVEWPLGTGAPANRRGE